MNNLRLRQKLKWDDPHSGTPTRSHLDNKDAHTILIASLTSPMIRFGDYEDPLEFRAVASHIALSD